jgi:hypothetical protein
MGWSVEDQAFDKPLAGRCSPGLAGSEAQARADLEKEVSDDESGDRWRRHLGGRFRL